MTMHKNCCTIILTKVRELKVKFCKIVGKEIDGSVPGLIVLTFYKPIINNGKLKIFQNVFKNMSGYKRVNFYELCRLCATNQQKEKTHIFQEEGRKIQLQNKIQSCLSLKVCENDFLPKVVCSQCLRTLEECSTFRKECYTSETMLSSYFNNFRYTEDFKRSGKVYIKDTSPKVVIQSELPVPAPADVTNSVNANNNGSYSLSGNVNQGSVPCYTLHLPSVIKQTQENKSVKDAKVVSHSQIIYNLNAFKAVVPNISRTNINDSVSNVAVNSNGEMFTIAPVVDVDTLFNQNIIQRSQKKNSKKHKVIDSNTKSLDDLNVIKIDLTQSDIDVKKDSIDKSKMQQNTVSYSLKVEDSLSKASFVPPHSLDVNNTNNLNKTTNFNNNQSIHFNLNPTRSTVSNANRISKSYSNFNNVNLTNSIPAPELSIPIININPTSEAVGNLNSDAPSNILPNISSASAINVSVSNYNTIQNIHYSMSNIKQDNVLVENNIGITSTDTVLTNIFNTTNLNRSNNISSQTTCPVLKNDSSSVSSQYLNFPNINPTPININNHTSGGNQINFNNASMADSVKQENTIKRHSCHICSKTFKRREHLYQHIKLHTGFRPFKCENCSKSFMRKEHLLRHITSHSGQKNFTCNVCEKSFSRNDNLLKHKKIHNKQNSFTCDICQKQFVMEHYYLAHKHTHDSEKLSSINPVWGLLKAI